MYWAGQKIYLQLIYISLIAVESSCASRKDDYLGIAENMRARSYYQVRRPKQAGDAA